MSDYQQKDGQGALFKNKRKTEESHPDYQGSATIKGIKYAFGAWIKKSKSGESYMSISIRPWQEKKSSPKASNDFDDSSIPF